jgi:hypothetical protein
MRVLLGVVLSVTLAFAGYAAAATVIFSTAIDADLRCDPDEVVVSGWSVLPSLVVVEAVELTDIDASCVDAELYVLVMQDGSPLADGSFIVDSGDAGANIANVTLTTVGASTTPELVPAADITGISVLLHRGSEPATGPPDQPCELLGMSIEGWGVELLSATVSSVRLVDVASNCIGYDLVMVLDQNGTVVADGRVLLTASNTGSDVLTMPLTQPGDSAAPISLHVTVITGIEVYVEGEVPDGPPPGPDASQDGQQPANQGVTTAVNIPVDLTDEVQGVQILPGGDTDEEPALVNEIEGVRRLPTTGSGGLLGSSSRDRAALHAAVTALIAGATITGLRLLAARRPRS